jgi:small redox-active disulfide protein 2
MRRLLVLGPGCPKCMKLAEAAREAATQLGLEFELEKVQDINQILSLGVMMTPALVVDGQVKVAGRVPTVEELKKLIA